MAAVTSTYNQFDGRMLDVETQLADTQTVTTSAALQVSSADKILDVGAGHLNADAVFDISTVDATTGDEQSVVLIQGSNSATFASGIVNLAAQLFGDSTKTGESSDNLGNERLVMPFSNVREGTTYRYIRGYVLNSGTSPSLIVNKGWLTNRVGR